MCSMLGMRAHSLKVKSSTSVNVSLTEDASKVETTHTEAVYVAYAFYRALPQYGNPTTRRI